VYLSGLPLNGKRLFMHMILMDSANKLAMNLRDTYPITENSNKRLAKKKWI